MYLVIFRFTTHHSPYYHSPPYLRLILDATLTHDLNEAVDSTPEVLSKGIVVAILFTVHVWNPFAEATADAKFRKGDTGVIVELCRVWSLGNERDLVSKAGSPTKIIRIPV